MFQFPFRNELNKFLRDLNWKDIMYKELYFLRILQILHKNGDFRTQSPLKVFTNCSTYTNK